MPYGSNFPSLNFRTTGSWGAGNGLGTSGRLTNTQADENIDTLGLAIEDLRDNPPTADGISNITSTAASFTIHLASGTTYGPFSLPVARLSWKGEWTSATAYQTNDIVKVTGDGVYLVLQDHTSAGSFDSGAADSDGDFYHFMIGAGADGADGSDGTNGTDGEDGATWYTGIGAPSVSDAVEGDLYLDTGDSDGTGEGDVYEHQGSDGFVLIASLKGEKGDTGDQGATGAGSTIIVEEGTVGLGDPVSNLNFDGDDFNVTQDSDGTANVSLANASTFSGALVTKSGHDAGADYTTATALTWDTETYDEGGWHSTGTNPSRLTVPAGVSRVRLTAHFECFGVTDGLWGHISILKNGSANVDPGLPSQRFDSVSATNIIHSIASAAVDVVGGDYFELTFQIETDTSITVASRSWFAIEEVA